MKFLPSSTVLLILLYSPVCSLAQVQNNGNLRMHQDSEIGMFGDFTNKGTFINNLGTVHVVGTTPQTFNGTNPIQTHNFTLNKADNSLQVDNILQVSDVLTFTNGMIYTDHIDIGNEFVEFLDGSSFVGESDTRHIDGVIRKTGNDAFVFPTGDNAFLRPIGISTPVNVTDHFTAYYTEKNPDGVFSRSLLDTGLDHVSGCEYWILNQTGGTSDVEVTLSWDSNSCGVDSLCDLLVARWDGTKWTSEGNGGVTGTVDSGTLVTGVACAVPSPVSNFSPFTLGSRFIFNVLPLTLISFNASVCQDSICLTWHTASERNNDFFTVEKSTNGLIWEDLEKIKGSGNSDVNLNYATIDRQPHSGLSYYRLKQTDLDGGFMHSSVEAVYIEKSSEKGLSIYPNPATNNITIKRLQSKSDDLKIYNMLGQDVTFLTKNIINTESMVLLDIFLLTPGVYQVRIINRNSSFIKH